MKFKAFNPIFNLNQLPSLIKHLHITHNNKDLLKVITKRKSHQQVDLQMLLRPLRKELYKIKISLVLRLLSPVTHSSIETNQLFKILLIIRPNIKLNSRILIKVLHLVRHLDTLNLVTLKDFKDNINSSLISSINSLCNNNSRLILSNSKEKIFIHKI
jgi:hypothetical protein